MTTTPTRTFRMPADALADLYRGDLQVVVNFASECWWSLGLIFWDGALPGEERAAARLEEDGVPVLWLHEDQLHQLATGNATELSCDGHRYLIVVDDVEQLDELLADEE